jgi:D-glycerate 3-kinase
MPSLNDTIANLIQTERLPLQYRDTIERHWVSLAAKIAALRAQKGTQIIIGINGAQGSGKSTLCVFLEVLLAQNHRLKAVTLSLDDLYLTKAERRSLAATLHPLFATRGVPGTHDLALARAVFADLKHTHGEVALPRFDKSIDDRATKALWPRVSLPIDVVLFEGWCIGATPQRCEALAAPVNTLEAEEDPDGHWRAAVNQTLAKDYPRLFAPLDSLIMLQAPSFEVILAWRQQQEAKLRDKTGHGMSSDELARFVAHYERLSRHQLAEMPGTADILIKLGNERQILSPTSMAKRWAHAQNGTSG